GCSATGVAKRQEVMTNSNPSTPNPISRSPGCCTTGVAEQQGIVAAPHLAPRPLVVRLLRSNALLAPRPAPRYTTGMSNRRIYDDALYAHFITFSCDRRRRLLDHDHPKRVVLDVLDAQLTHQSARCVGFVIMPDHVHAIVWFPETGQLSRFVHEWKR